MTGPDDNKFDRLFGGMDFGGGDMTGITVIRLMDDGFDIPDWRRDSMDMLLAIDPAETISMVGIGRGAPPPSRRFDAMGFLMPYPPQRREITFIDTPKPLSKRRARRLRGRKGA
jgi:hypothetical protein